MHYDSILINPLTWFAQLQLTALSRKVKTGKNAVLFEETIETERERVLQGVGESFTFPRMINPVSV